MCIEIPRFTLNVSRELDESVQFLHIDCVKDVTPLSMEGGSLNEEVALYYHSPTQLVSY